MSEKLSKKYVISRKLLVIGSIILIPVVLLLIYLVQGFVNNRVTPLLKSQFDVDDIEFVDGEDFSDFSLSMSITSYTYPTSEDGSKDGSIVFSYTYQNTDGRVASDVTFKWCVTDYWAAYCSTAITTSSISPSTTSTTKTKTLSTLAYSNTNGWGVTQKITDCPDVYVYLDYDFVDEYGTSSHNTYILKYKFLDIFTGGRKTK